MPRHPPHPDLADRSTVLVVEDDPVLSPLTQAQLADRGYATRVARTAEEALGILRSGERVDAVFSDIVLPGDASGLQLARTIREEFPAVPILLTTGFEAAFEVARIRGVETIAKPYDVEKIADRLEELIKGEAG